GDRVAISERDRVRLFDRASGELRRVIEVGACLTRLEGPPLVAVAHAGDEADTLLLLDGTGVVARQTFGPVFDLVTRDGTILLVHYPGDAGCVLRALRGSDLSEIWSWPPELVGGLTTRDGRLIVERADATGQGWRYQPIDPLTGEVGPELPAGP